MPDPTDIVKRLRDYASCTDSDVDDAATAIETLLAQRAVLVEEVEAWREWGERYHGRNWSGWCNSDIPSARAATDAAFTEGLKK